MSAGLDHAATVAEIRQHAEAMDRDHVRELALHALRLKDRKPVPQPPYDDLPVLALLKDYWSLSHEDKRKFKRHVATIDRKEGIAP